MNREQYEKQGRRNRRRGKDTQREYARFNCRIWGQNPETDAVWDQSHPDNVYLLPPGRGHHVEVKGEKSWYLPAWIREAEQDAVKRARDEHKPMFGSGLNWWIGSARPSSEWRRYQEPWYVIAPELLYFQRVIEAYTSWDWYEEFPKTPEKSMELRYHLAEDYQVLVQDRRYEKRWLLSQWVPEFEAHFEGSDHDCVRWILVLAAPQNTPTHSYLHPHYVLLPGSDWAEILMDAWTRSRGGDA